MRILLSALLISMATAYPSTCEEMRDVRHSDALQNLVS